MKKALILGGSFTFILLSGNLYATDESINSNLRNQTGNAVSLVKSQIRSRFNVGKPSQQVALNPNRNQGMNAGDEAATYTDINPWAAPYFSTASNRPQKLNPFDSTDDIRSFSFGFDGLLTGADLLLGASVEFAEFDTSFNDSESKETDSAFVNFYLAKLLNEHLVAYGLIGYGDGDVEREYMGLNDNYDTDRYSFAAGVIYSKPTDLYTYTLDTGLIYATIDEGAYNSLIEVRNIPDDTVDLGQFVANSEFAFDHDGSAFQTFVSAGIEYDFEMEGTGDDVGFLVGIGARASESGKYDFETYLSSRLGRDQIEDDYSIGMNLRVYFN